MTLLRFEQVEKTFGRRRILDAVSIDLEAGGCQLLCGENGAGKSTLLRILAGMERPDDAAIAIGSLRLGWRAAKKQLLARCIYLHQQPYMFEGSVRYNLNYPLRGSRADRSIRIQEALSWSGLSAIADQDVHQLSGGERQRLALARAWLRQPKIMLLDEPTANMDLHCRQRTVELLRVLKAEGVCLVVASHDPLHFADVADRTLDLVEGKLLERSSAYADLPEKVTPIDRFARILG